jgi:hypothetical protein
MILCKEKVITLWHPKIEQMQQQVLPIAQDIYSQSVTCNNCSCGKKKDCCKKYKRKGVHCKKCPKL